MKFFEKIYVNMKPLLILKKKYILKQFYVRYATVNKVYKLTLFLTNVLCLRITIYHIS